MREKPLWFVNLRGPHSIPEVMRRQFLRNAFAAFFASIAAACQAAILYLPGG